MSIWGLSGWGHLIRKGRCWTESPLSSPRSLRTESGAFHSGLVSRVSCLEHPYRLPRMHSAEFSYDLPPEAIAQEAIEPRDAARLLVARTLEDRSFTDLPDLLDPGDLVVVNNTRVRPARVYATKETGGRVELLLTKRITATTWEALVRPARRIRPGTELTVGPLTMVVATEPDRGVVTLEVSPERSVDEVLRELGEVPLPPYFHGTLDDDERYQTIFARAVGSAAAPTAALHFTPRIVGALHARNIGIVEVELEVGLDTFRPMDDGPISDHEMHEERYTVPVATADAIAETKLRRVTRRSRRDDCRPHPRDGGRARRGGPGRVGIDRAVHHPGVPNQGGRRGCDQLPCPRDHADRDDRRFDRPHVA